MLQDDYSNAYSENGPKSRLPPPKSVAMKSKRSEIMNSTFLSEDISPPGSSNSRRSLNQTVVVNEKSPNLSYTVGDSRHDSPEFDLNTTVTLVEKSRFNSTFDTSSSYRDLNSTFKVQTPSSSTPSPQDEAIAAQELSLTLPQNLYDIAEDDVEESSLGLLTPSQMLDFSFGNDISNGALRKEVGSHLHMPKTHSCDDINDLPEEEVVEDITVEYVKSDLGSSKSHIVSTPHQTPRYKSPTEVPPIKYPLTTGRSSSTPLTKVLSKDRPSTVEALNLNSPIASEHCDDSPMSNMSDLNLSTNSAGMDITSMLEDQNITLCNMSFSLQDSQTTSPVESVAASDLRKQLQLPADKAEQLVSILKTLPIGEALLRTLKEVDVSKLQGLSTSLVKERADVLETAAELDNLDTKDNHQRSTATPMTKSVEWASEVVSRKHRLVSSTGSLSNCDPNVFRSMDGTMTIETVMEQIQRGGELYKNRPTSTYTVGSADTGYQGDAEFDLQSEIGTNAGSPCDEAKHLSMCSTESGNMQEDGDHNDKMAKSGHMSDSDFFTDPGGNSENEAEPKGNCSSDPKHCILSTSVDGAKPLSGIAEDEDDTMVEASSELEETKLERTIQNKLDLTLIETPLNPNGSSTESSSQVQHTPTQEKVDTSDLQMGGATAVTPNKSGPTSEFDDPKKGKDGDSPASVKSRANRTPKRPQVVVSKAAPVKVVGVSKLKALLEANTAASEEAAAKRAARTPKKSRWDSVTAKISDDKDKPKVKKEIKSRINTNLAGARQPNVPKKFDRDNDGSVASGHQTPSSKSQTITAATDSILPMDPTSRGSSGGTDEAMEPTSQASNSTNQKDSFSCATSEICSIRAISPTAPSERSTTSSRFSRPISIGPSKIALRSIPGVGPSKLAGPTAPPRRSITSRYAVPNIPPPIAPKPRPKDVIQTQTSKSTSSTPHATPTARLRPTQLLGKVDELSKEVQRLGALCEARTKELNMVRMQTKHTALGFDAFGVLVKYLVGELDAFSHPELVADIHKTKEQLITLETVLKQYEADVESMKKVHSEQLDLIAAQLAHSEEEVLKVSNALTDANVQHMKQVRNLSEQHDRDSKEIQQRHDLSMDRITITHQKQLDDTQIEHSQRLEQVVESHDFEKSELQMKLDSLQQRYQTLEAQTRSFEEALNKDTDSKIQWISAKNSELQKEVDSLKSVLDMKQTEIHELRNENMKMKKQLDELPMERHRVKKLQARNEELQALVREKVKTEKKLSFDHRNLKELVEQEEKLKQQLSMENEELQWKLKNSLDCSSMTNISIEGNTISMMATPELAAKVRNFRMMSSAPLSPFHEAAEDQMSRSLPNFSDESQPSCIVSNNSIVGKLSYTKPKPKRPSKSCSASPHKSLCHPHSSSTPAAHSIRKPLDLTTHHHHHPELDETLDISRGSSRSLDSPRSIAELHFKACLQIDAMEEMAVMTGSGLDAETRNILLRSPDVMSSDSGGAGGCSSLASSSVAEDGMSASVSSVEPDDKELGALTPDPDFIQGVYSPRNEAGEAMVNELPQSPGGSSNPHAKHHHRRHFQEDLVTYSNPAANGDHPTTATTTTSLTTSSYDNCFCDDFEYNSEPE